MPVDAPANADAVTLIMAKLGSVPLVWFDLVGFTTHSGICSASKRQPKRSMRLRLQVLATIATLFVSVPVAQAASDSAAKKTFTVVSPGSNDTLEGLYVQSEGRKFLILYDDSSETGSEESEEHSILNDGSSYEGETSSDGSADQEERAGAISPDTVTKVKKVFPKEYNSIWNKALYYLFQKLTPKNRRIPSR